MAHATLQDFSPCGAKIARRGRLLLEVGTPVLLQFHIPGTDRRRSREAEVRWVRFAGFNTYMGLRFTTPLTAEDPLLAALLGDPDRTGPR
jgi:hypothetical protein